ncbi:DUF3048 domain-containing protein [uncultured Clostridium sp.]|uniref:DUF3048 domain-containing protein n=1 Tax=uncultured Clostridium sp. TaxID=59620 RepID=UPI002605F9F0|nr:DUF3048 domain-containing protein [uncultured Clostridium sp.]
MKKLISTLAIFSTIFLIGCNDKQSIDTSTKSTQTPEKILTYPYTGEVTSENLSDLTPYMTIIENSKSARPQSGLSGADIIYETSAEGGIPRFLALFHKNSPNKLGPIRSVRPYFLTLSKEHALPIAHCGGSSEALKDIKNDSSLMSLNEMSNSSFYYRDTKRTAPHNLYSSSDLILKGIASKNYNVSSKNFFDYSQEPLAHSTESATDISVVTNRTYTTDYKFENGKYIKYMDGEIAIDANNNDPLSFKNVIVQRTNINLNSDGTHLDINLIGSGDGFLFIDGKKMNITWSKDSEYDKTKFYDSEGNNLTLAPGNTIINIIDTNGKVQINN